MTFYLTMYSAERTVTPVSFVLSSLDAGKPTTFSMERGSRSVVPLGNGRAQDTFSVYVKQTDAGGVRSRIGSVYELLRAARLYHAQIGHTNAIYIEEATDDELARRALVYGGAVSVTDDDFDQWTLEGGHATFTITIEREAVWEWPALETWTPTAMLSHGETRTTPSDFWKGNVPGRIVTTTVQPAQGGIKRVWLGIKPASAGRDLSGFNSLIRVGSGRSSLGQNAAKLVSTSSSDDDWQRHHDDTAVEFNFTTYRDWTTRFWCEMQNWNSSTLTEANRLAYIGEYHLLARYRTTDSAATTSKFGVEASVGWRGSSTRQYLGPRYVKATAGSAQYVDLGRLRIGSGWGAQHSAELVLKTLTIYIDGAVFDYQSGDALIIDSMRLVPAEHSIFVETSDLFRDDRKLAILTNEQGRISAYLLFGWDALAPVHTGEVHDEAAAIDAQNWAMPPDVRSRIVIVADSGDRGSLPISYHANLEMQVAPRTESYR